MFKMPNRRHLIKYFPRTLFEQGYKNTVCYMAVEHVDIKVLEYLKYKGYQYKPKYYNFLSDEILGFLEDVDEFEDNFLFKKIKCLRYINVKLGYSLAISKINIEIYPFAIRGRLLDWFNTSENMAK